MQPHQSRPMVPQNLGAHKLCCARWIFTVKAWFPDLAETGAGLELSPLQSPAPAQHLTWFLLLGISILCSRFNRQLRRGTGLILPLPVVPPCLQQTAPSCQSIPEVTSQGAQPRRSNTCPGCLSAFVTLLCAHPGN